MMRVLLSAYGCEPDRGSEPGVGWRWANGLAGRVDLTVLTRKSNQSNIEAGVARSAEDDPLRKVRFLYHDLPGWVLFLKKTGLLPMMGYYMLWQWAARRKLRSRLEEFDSWAITGFNTASTSPQASAFVIRSLNNDKRLRSRTRIDATE